MGWLVKFRRATSASYDTLSRRGMVRVRHAVNMRNTGGLHLPRWVLRLQDFAGGEKSSER